MLSTIRFMSNLENCAGLDFASGNMKALIFFGSVQTDPGSSIAADFDLVMAHDLTEESLAQRDGPAKLSEFCAKVSGFYGNAQFEMNNVDLVVAGGELAQELAVFLQEQSGSDDIVAQHGVAGLLRAALEHAWCCEA